MLGVTLLKMHSIKRETNVRFLASSSLETPDIFLLPPPEVHLLIGPVDKMYAAIESLWPDSKNWLKLCNVKKEDCHGGSFAKQ